MNGIGRACAGLLLVVGLTSGCGTESSPSPSAPRPSAPSARPATPSPAVTATPAASLDPGLAGTRLQQAYFDLADAYNPPAARALAILTDASSSSAVRADARAVLAEAERTFAAGLAVLPVPPELVAERDALRDASEGVLAAIDAPGTEARELRTAVATAGERASAFRQAMVDWSGTWLAHEDAVKVLGAGAEVAAPGEIWVTNGGWTISDWRATYTAYVENPWDGYAFDVEVRVEFSPPDGPFGGVQTGKVPVIGPGCRGSVTQTVEAPVGYAQISQIRGEVVRIGTWRASADSGVGAR